NSSSATRLGIVMDEIGEHLRVSGAAYSFLEHKRCFRSTVGKSATTRPTGRRDVQAPWHSMIATCPLS
ncbi:MAG: hypothetical protein AAB393_16495, partial [Bacteroidota bacterium]